MSVSLYLNKTKVDTYTKPMTRNIRIGEVSEVGKLKSSFSYTDSLPKTAKNVAFFEMLGVIGNTSRKPYELIVADYVVDGIYLVMNGIAVVKEADEDFKYNLIDGVRSLSELLKGQKLIDLPLNDLTHILTTQNYIDSFENTEGYIYGIANYGRSADSGSTTDVKVEKQAPSIYVHTLFRRIFESNNLTLQGDFFNYNEDYLNEVLAPSNGYEVEAGEVTSTAKGGAVSDELSDTDGSNDFITFEEGFTLTDNSLIGASIVDGKMKFAVSGIYKIDMSILYSINQTNAAIKIKLNDATISYISLSEGYGQELNKSIVLTVGVDDVISFMISGSSYTDPEFFIIDYNVQFDSSIYLQTGGQVIKASDYIGDMLQIDFVKDIVNRYGLLLHPIQNTNQFRFKRLEALLKDRATHEDWSSKLGEIGGENYVSGYAKRNVAKYKYPEAIVVPNNDGEMLIDNDNALNEKTFFSSPFEIPVKYAMIYNNQTYQLPIWSEDDEGTPVNEEQPLRIMKIERFDISFTAKLFDEMTGITVSTNVPFLNLKNMSMQYFLSNYYPAFQSLMDNYKKRKFMFNLSPIDIYNLDFFKLKFLKQTGRFYYMNRVQYTPGKQASVELIEIKELT